MPDGKAKDALAHHIGDRTTRMLDERVRDRSVEQLWSLGITLLFVVVVGANVLSAVEPDGELASDLHKAAGVALAFGAFVAVAFIATAGVIAVARTGRWAKGSMQRYRRRKAEGKSV